MSDRYTIIKTELVDPNLEAKVVTEPVSEAEIINIPEDLYAAIVDTAPTSVDVSGVSETDIKQYSYTVPTRLYTAIVPEKPNILAEERIFVYVPKATPDTAGIATFTKDQFTVINGEVSLKFSYLVELISNQLINLDIIIVTDVLPSVGSENHIYIVPVDTTANAYFWNRESNTWSYLGNMAINLNNYYTKDQMNQLIENIETGSASLIVSYESEPLGVDFYIKIET